MNGPTPINEVGIDTASSGLEGNDTVSGGNLSEDVLVDGPDATGAGNDTLNGFGGDDALLHNAGADNLNAGDGNDLFLSSSVCDGAALNGGPGSDNASWAKSRIRGSRCGLPRAFRGDQARALDRTAVPSHLTRSSRSRTSRAAPKQMLFMATPAPTICLGAVAATSSIAGKATTSFVPTTETSIRRSIAVLVPIRR
jgi:hypothetical protein